MTAHMAARGLPHDGRRAKSAFTHFECNRCDTRTNVALPGSSCGPCEAAGFLSPWVAQYDTAAATEAWNGRSGHGIWRYSGLLPIAAPDMRICLGAGNTPLTLWDNAGPTVWIKNEAANPTWSYKDRLATVGVSAARQSGASIVAASSSGNHGAATAALAAAAGLGCVVFIHREASRATSTLIQSFGADVFTTTGPGRWAWLARGVERHGWYPLSSYSQRVVGNAYGIEGYKTIAFELVEQLGRAPRVVIVPTCYGEGLAGIWSGFLQLKSIGVIDGLPAMIAVEPAGGAPLARALDLEDSQVQPVPSYRSVAASIAATVSSNRALSALRDSNGTAVRVGDSEILGAHRQLAARGLYTEPSASAALAALAHLPVPVDAGDDVVLVLTAGGLRTYGVTAQHLPEPRELPANPDAISEDPTASRTQP